MSRGLFILRSLLRAWDRFWFRRGHPVNLAAARIFVTLQALWVLLSRDYAAAVGLPAPFWDGVPVFDRIRYLAWPGNEVLEHGLQSLAAISLACALLGVASRTACLVSGLLLYHLAPLEALIWTPSPYVRGMTLSVLALLILACSPCDHALAFRSRAETARRWEYAWPVKLIQLLLAQVYLFSAWAKLRHSGTSWASAESMRTWLLYMSQDQETAVFQSLGPWLADVPAIPAIIGGSSLVFEALFPIALVSRAGRLLLVPAAVAFHIGILLAMNLTFPSLPLLLVFVDWPSCLGKADLRARPLPR